MLTTYKTPHEITVCEARLILDEALGRRICEPPAEGETDFQRLYGEELLYHAIDYLDEQLPDYLRSSAVTENLND